jgi:TatD family-associated radical SAM protein
MGLGSAQSLWHTADPTWEEVRTAIEQFDFSPYDEAVFCGYGEPFCALNMLEKAAKLLKAKYPTLALRVNTNGLGDLINNCDSAAPLVGSIDRLSVSLNAPNPKRYDELTRSNWGIAAFEALLSFVARAKPRFPQVKLSVVDVLTPKEIHQSEAIAEQLGVPLRVRVRT